MYVLINLFATNSCVKYICPFERILKLFALDVSSNLFVMIAAVKYLFVVICLPYLLISGLSTGYRQRYRQYIILSIFCRYVST